MSSIFWTTFLVANFAAFAATAEPEIFRDWAVDCDGDRCSAAQTLSAEDRTWLATLEVMPTDDTAELVIRLPLGVHIASGVFISDGATTLYPAAFTRCTPNGCQANIDMSSDMIAGWRRGTRAQVRYRPSSESAVLAFEASLLGVTAALDAAGVAN